MVTYVLKYSWSKKCPHSYVQNMYIVRSVIFKFSFRAVFRATNFPTQEKKISWLIQNKILTLVTCKNDESVEIVVWFTITIVLFFSPNHWNHPEHFWHKNHWSCGFVNIFFVIIVKFFFKKFFSSFFIFIVPIVKSFFVPIFGRGFLMGVMTLDLM